LAVCIGDLLVETAFIAKRSKVVIVPSNGALEVQE